MEKKNLQTKKPELLVFAGPNGSGKTTLTKSIQIIGTYINADDIKLNFSLSDLDSAKTAESLREKLLTTRSDFTFETVLSTRRNIDLMQRAKNIGYKIICFYVLTKDPQLNVLRVKERTISGGHDVPKEKIISRYKKALLLIPELLTICDTLIIFDNTDEPSKIFSKINDRIEIQETVFWSKEEIEKLVGII